MTNSYTNTGAGKALEMLHDELAAMGGHIDNRPSGAVLVLYDQEENGLRQEYRIANGDPQVRVLTRGGGYLRDGASQWADWRIPLGLSPLSPILRFFAQNHRCATCPELVGLLAIFTAVQRGKWAVYCSPRCRETAKKRRRRSAIAVTQDGGLHKPGMSHT